MGRDVVGVMFHQSDLSPIFQGHVNELQRWNAEHRQSAGRTIPNSPLTNHSNPISTPALWQPPGEVLNFQFHLINTLKRAMEAVCPFFL